MAGHNRSESVSVSFHYLQREVRVEENDPTIVPISQNEFDELCQKVRDKPALNLNNEEEKDKLRYRSDVPLTGIEIINNRTFFGRFFASYWGHAFDNTEKGKIPADSISLRPFYFLCYLAESGRIYLASQYLGRYGGYVGLQRTIRSMLPHSGTIFSHSFRLDGYNIENAVPKKVEVSLTRRAGNIIGNNPLRNEAMISFENKENNDQFNAHVHRRVLGLIGRPKDEIKRALAILLSENELLDVRDEDIDDCNITVLNGKKQTKIYLFDEGGFASRFPIDVPLDVDGHPLYDETREAILALLRGEIIPRKENV